MARSIETIYAVCLLREFGFEAYPLESGACCSNLCLEECFGFWTLTTKRSVTCSFDAFELIASDLEKEVD